MQSNYFILFTLLVNFISTQSSSSASSVQAILDLKTKINKLTVHAASSQLVNLYVASTNHLYKLSDSLENSNLEEDTTSKPANRIKIDTDLLTGPKQQKPLCTVMPSSSSASSCIKYICDEDSTQLKQSISQSSLIDNENRLLLVDSKRDQLIECGTIDYGGCRLRRLTDLSIIGCNYSAPVIPFSSASGVVTSSSSDDNLLYLMVSVENDPTDRLDKSEFPVFSIRNLAFDQQHQQTQQLNKLQLFQLKYPIEYMNYDQTLFDSDFHMKIVYSFKHDGFVYFLFTITNRITQSCSSIITSPANNQTSSTVVTRLLRICDSTWSAHQKTSRNNRDNQESLEQLISGSPTSLATLSELVIDCDDPLTGTKYHILQAAHFHSNASEPTLFMSFNTTTSTKTSQSAVCSIRLKKLDEQFSTMLNKCLEGNNNYAELVSPYSNKNTWKVPCRCSVIADYWKKSAQFDIINNERKLFCHNDYFNYMNGRQPITLQAIRLDVASQLKSISSLVTLSTNLPNKLVLIVATLDAQIFMFTYDELTNEANKYDQINLPSVLVNYSFMINRQTAMSINLATSDESTHRLLYITYDRYLVKVNLQNCAQFQTCDACMLANLNPFCGWCIYEQKCTPEQVCLQQTQQKQKISSESLESQSVWLKSNESCPSIGDITPSRYFNPLLVSSYSEPIQLSLNLKLSPHIKYFCDVNTNMNDFSSSLIQYSTTLNRIEALYMNESQLQCDLRPIKAKFQKVFSRAPIENKLANLTLQVRAATTSQTDSIATTLLTSTKLFAFNCSYFTQCGQCLNKNLNGGCVWCASNSKCIFTQDTGNNKICPNELEYYSFGNNDMCTSYSIASKSNKRIEIAYSSDSSLSHYADLVLHNRRPNYQIEFKCVFTKTRVVNNTNKLQSGSSLRLLSDLSESEKKFDCVYSPYRDLNQLDSESAFQTVYMSVWWTNKLTSDANSNWHQVRFKSDLNDLFQEEDNVENFIEINIVNCKVKAASCGQCMDKQLIDLGCGWCRSTSKCSIKKDCINDWINDLNNTDGNSYCSNPQISGIKPACGPRQSAGTQLMIQGQNLGLTPYDITVKMKPVGDLQPDLDCDLLSDMYTKASRVVCRTKPLNDQITLSDYSVYVETNTRSQSVYTSFNQSSQFVFKYVQPQVLSVEPRRGIKSGGTLLKITGKHLACGSSLVFQMAGSQCQIINILSDSSLDYVYCRTPMFNQTLPASPILPIQLRMDDYVLDLNQFKFEYVNDPKIVSYEPDKTIMSGGLVFTVKGRDFDNIQTASLILTSNLLTSRNLNDLDEFKFKSKCKIINSTHIECLTPQISDKRLASLNSVDYLVQIQFNDLVKSLYENSIQIYPEPVFKEDQIFSDKTSFLLIEGENLLRGVKESDYKVLIGENTLCNITSITMNLIACMLPNESDLLLNNTSTTRSRLYSKRDDIIIKKLKPSTSVYDVRVQIGQNFERTIGLLKFDATTDFLKYSDSIQVKYIIAAACLVSLVLFMTMIACFVTLKRRQNKQIRQLKRMQTEFENLEMRVARECKEAFTELQMDIGELANTLNQTGAPFHDFQTYCMKILLPNSNDTERYYMTSLIDLRISTTNKENVRNGILMFSQLILNKKFLITFIHTLEADTHSFLLQDRVNLASYISICLHDRMDYFTDVLLTLLGELIEKLIETKNNPKILLRRNESVAEKMLTNWFAFLLYDFIHNCAGTPLYILFLSLKQQIYKGPVDAISCEARYSLSEDKLIRQSIDYDTITIRVQLQDFDEQTHELTVKVLSCDTITQVKEKVLDAFFKGYPFSKRPLVDDLDFVYVPNEYATKTGHSGRLVLYDEDKTCKIDSDDFKRLNTLAHYKIPNGSLFILIPRQSYQLMHSNNNEQCNSYTLLDVNRNAENMTLLSKSSKGSSSPPTYSKLSTNGLNEYNNLGNANNYSNGSVTVTADSNRLNHTINYKQSMNQNKQKKYHLIKANESHYNTTPSLKEDASKQQVAAKLVSEVYLTRLLATKGGMQSYVDDFFETVFSTAHGSNVLPYAIKYLFDFLDEQAIIHGIGDSDVVYTWKSNSLPLRFWVNIIKNPDFVFDIYKSNIVDASLSVIASTFMDSCSQSRLDLNKESPSGKLLFYKEVHKYRKWVESYYADIKHMPKINEQDMNEMLNEESKKRPGVFNKTNALYRLYNDYVKKFRVKIENALNNEFQDPSVVSINKHLNYRLQQVIYLMEAIEV